MTPDYRTLPHPDYDTHPGMKGHAPETEEEARQGYVKRSWAGRVVRLRCCHCPFECAFIEQDMRLHLFKAHWLKANPQDGTEEASALREPKARLFDGNGKLITAMPVAAHERVPALRTEPSPVAARVAPVPMENFLGQDITERLEAAVADMLETGELNGAHED